MTLDAISFTRHAWSSGPLAALFVACSFVACSRHCYRLTPRFALPPSERCYFRGINLETTGKNPIDDSPLDGVATSVVLNAPLDDALFTIPAGFARETASTDEIMHRVYTELVERMKEASFTLESLDRYATVPK